MTKAAIEGILITELGGIHNKDVIAAEAIQKIVINTAVDQIVPVTAIDHIIATAAVDGVVAAATVEAIGAIGDIQYTVYDFAVAPIDNVIAFTAVDIIATEAAVERVVTDSADHLVDAVASLEDVVAGITPEEVIATKVGDQIITIAAVQEVVAGTAFHAVVTTIGPDGFVAAKTIDLLGEISATNQAAGIAGPIWIGNAARVLIITGVVGEGPAGGYAAHPTSLGTGGFQGQDAGVGGTSLGSAIKIDIIFDFNNVIGNRENIGIKMLGTSVAHHQIGKRHFIHGNQDVLRGTKASDVIQAIGILQIVHLHREDAVHRGTEHASLGFPLSQAA